MEYLLYPSSFVIAIEKFRTFLYLTEIHFLVTVNGLNNCFTLIVDGPKVYSYLVALFSESETFHF